MALSIDQYGVYSYTNASGLQIVLSPTDFNNRGDYSGAATYAPLDVITYLGALYINLQASTGIAPSGNRSNYWSALVLLEPGDIPEVDCCLVGSNALQIGTNALEIATSGSNLAMLAWDLAQVGTESGGGGGSSELAGQAFTLAAIGTNVGTNAYDRAGSALSGANSAFNIAVQGTYLGDLAYSLAAIGTNVGTNALNVAQTALGTANSAAAVGNSAFSLAAQGTNTGTLAYETALSGVSGANSAFSVAVQGTNAARNADTTATVAYNIALQGTYLAQLAYDLAQIGTTTGGGGDADAAYTLAAIGTNVGTNALNLAQSAQNAANSALGVGNAAFTIAVAGTTLAGEVYGLAQTGTNLAHTGSNLAYLAYELALIGTQSGTGGGGDARDANGNLYTDDAVNDPGAPTGLVNGIYMVQGTMPTAMPQNTSAMWVQDANGSETKAAIHVITEDGTKHVFGPMFGINTIDPQSTLHVEGDILAKTYETDDSAILIQDFQNSSIVSNDLEFPDNANHIIVGAGTINTVSNVRAGAEYTILATGDVLINKSSDVVIRGAPILLHVDETAKCLGRGPTEVSFLP